MTDDDQNRTDVVAQRRRSKTFDEHSIEHSEGATETIVSAVSTITDTDPLEMDPIHDVVDVEALEELFRPMASGKPRSSGTVSFSYAGCEVIVEGTDQVEVKPKERQRE